jgi:hypothetical protein
MSDWLDPVRAALDAAATPVAFVFRDDDAGWEDDALFRLLDRCHAHRVHIDLAVIPAALTHHLAAALRERSSTGIVHLHQHGFRHVNHETVGRRCEFGASRDYDQQLADIAEGRHMLTALLSGFLEPVFTPPWNRCTDDTAAALIALGFGALSRDRTAVAFARPQLVESPVTVDWFAKNKHGALSRQRIGAQLAEQVANAADHARPIGVMLHHAVTDLDELAVIDQLLALVGTHPQASSTSIYRNLQSLTTVRSA